MDDASKAGFLTSHSDPLPTSHSSWPVVSLLLPLSFSYVPDSLTHARPRQKRVGEARVMKDQSKCVWGTAISTCGFRMNLITPVDASAGNKGGWAVFIGVIIYNEKDQHWRRSRCEDPCWDAMEGFFGWRFDLFPQTSGRGVKGHLSFHTGRRVTGLLQEWMRALYETLPDLTLMGPKLPCACLNATFARTKCQVFSVERKSETPLCELYGGQRL